MEMSTHLDPNLAQKIVHEVKFQGVFDEFRKDSIADVDTKPAYLNLRQRVENAVQKFLSEQRWTPDTNKYQLRERLRRHITESGFLDVGVERIVDQVVNPKIGSVFQPRIEEIAYKYLGLPPPVKRENAQMPQIPYPNAVNGNALKIETMPTEPENLLPKDLEQVSPDSDKTAVEDEKVDDEEDESPPFESLADCKSPIKTENVESNEVKLEVKTDLEKEEKEVEVKKEIEIKQEQSSPVDNETKLSTTPVECPSVDGLASQESQLSQVSSDTTSNQLNQSGSDPPTNLENAATANISEEAQMPKFNENSTETEGNTKKISDLHFDIKKDEIKFEGTERMPNLLDGEQNESITDEPPVIESAFDGIEAKSAFNFTKLVKVEPPYNTTQEAASSVSSPDDTSSAQLCIVEKSEQDTNSIQKTLPEESNATTTTLNNSQSKVNDEKRKSKTSSSTSSSRHKKSSKSSRRTPDRNHRHDDKDQRERSSKNGSDHRQSDSKHTSKHYLSSTEKHSTSSSKREEKRSSSSRSESQSRHSSSKRDSYRDRHDSSKRHRSHKSHRSDKDNYKSRKPSSADDHGEFKEKSRRRKSTDSNDEDKSPSATKNVINNTKSNAEAISSMTTTTQTSGSTKSNNNESNKHSKDNRQNDVPNNLSSLPESVNINSSKVVVVNEILTDPALGVVEIETKSATTAVPKANKNIASADEEGELFYFDEPKESDHKQRLSLLDEAISRCNFAYKAYDKTQQSDEVDEAVNSTNKNNNNIEKSDQKMKATLQVDCFQYTHNGVGVDNDQVQTCSTSSLAGQQHLAADNNEAVVPAAKRFKFDAAECETEAKKPGAPKRALSLTKQRYESEDLYKPRPILGQRIKRRGLDA